MTATARPSRPARQDTAATRLRLLEAGRELLLAEGSLDHVNIRLADACTRAGYTTGAAYPIWGSQRHFQEDLAGFVVSSFEFAGPDTIAEELAQIVADTDDYVVAARRATKTFLDRFVLQDDFYLALRFWPVRTPSTELAAALAEGYRAVHESWTAMFEGLLAVYERRLRPPATIDQLAVILSALLEGLALRHRIEPDVVDQPVTGVDGVSSTLFAEGMIAVLERLTEPIS